MRLRRMALVSSILITLQPGLGLAGARLDSVPAQRVYRDILAKIRGLNETCAVAVEGSIEAAMGRICYNPSHMHHGEVLGLLVELQSIVKSWAYKTCEDGAPTKPEIDEIEYTDLFKGLKSSGKGRWYGP